MSGWLRGLGTHPDVLRKLAQARARCLGGCAALAHTQMSCASLRKLAQDVWVAARPWHTPRCLAQACASSRKMSGWLRGLGTHPDVLRKLAQARAGCLGGCAALAHTQMSCASLRKLAQDVWVAARPWHTPRFLAQACASSRKMSGWLRGLGTPPDVLRKLAQARARCLGGCAALAHTQISCASLRKLAQDVWVA